MIHPIDPKQWYRKLLILGTSVGLSLEQPTPGPSGQALAASPKRMPQLRAPRLQQNVYSNQTVNLEHNRSNKDCSLLISVDSAKTKRPVARPRRDNKCQSPN